MFRLSAIVLATSLSLHAAPVFQPLEAFVVPPAEPLGRLTCGPDGNFYGMSTSGGAYGYGTVFRITPSGSLAVIASFDPSADSPSRSGIPDDGLVLGADGNYYGTTSFGGRIQWGNIIRVTPSGEITVLHEFQSSEGWWPTTGLTAGPDGAFYGTTTLGGTHNLGTLYRVTPQGDFTVLTQLDSSAGGSPHSSLTLGQDGNLYGVTTTTEPGATGCFFRLTPGGVFSILANLPGNQATQPILAQDGNFYASAWDTGRGGRLQPLVIRITPQGAITRLHGFPDGTGPIGPLCQTADGTFYGTGSYGSLHGGTVYRYTPDDGFTILHEFDSDAFTGDMPSGGLVVGPDGSLYGTTAYVSKGENSNGTAFKITPDGRFTLLNIFGADQGTSLEGNLLQDRDGSFLVTTSAGGVRDFGTVLRIRPDRTSEVLHGFTQGYRGDRASQSGLVAGWDGNYYGTTAYGGAEDGGTFFRLSRRGDFRQLAEFTTKGPTYPTGLTLGSDGAFYITCSNGTDDWLPGGILRASFLGRLSPFGTFDPTTIGAGPLGALVEGPGRTFYGVTRFGGTSDFYTWEGKVFSLSPRGKGTTFHSTGNPQGGGASAGLAAGPDGCYYGVTTYDGANGCGTVFEIDSAGRYTVLLDMPSGPASNPDSRLLFARDGNLYGTSSRGDGDVGSIFRVTPDGDLTILETFDYLDTRHGYDPMGGLTQGADGHLYGTTLSGGTTSDGRPAGGGQFFRIRLGASSTAGAPTGVVWNGATLHGTVDPSGSDTAATFEVSLDPGFRHPLKIRAGTIAAAEGSTPVSAAISRLLPGRTYWVRLVTVNAENPVPQSSEPVPLATPKR